MPDATDSSLARVTAVSAIFVSVTALAAIAKAPAAVRVASPDKATAVGLLLALPTIILPDATDASFARLTAASAIFVSVIALSLTVVAEPFSVPVIVLPVDKLISPRKWILPVPLAKIARSLLASSPSTVMDGASAAVPPVILIRFVAEVFVPSTSVAMPASS